MRNRAKCRLCKSIIESQHPTDIVQCDCGEISVEGGPAMRCAANDWVNFLRVDDHNNEIIVKVKTLPQENISDHIPEKPNRLDLLNMLDEMVKNVENLPQHALTQPINHYDYCSLMILLSSILRADP